MGLRAFVGKHKVALIAGSGSFGAMVAIIAAIKSNGGGPPGGLYDIALVSDKLEAPVGGEFMFTTTVTNEETTVPAPGIQVHTIIDGFESTVPMSMRTDRFGKITFIVRNLEVGPHTVSVVTATQVRAISDLVNIMVTGPTCPAYHRYETAGAVCVPRVPGEGMVLQDLGIDFTYDFGFSGGKWRVEGFVESPGPYPAWLYFVWADPQGVIGHDERGGSASGINNQGEKAESIGDVVARNPANWDQQCSLYIYATLDPMVRYPGEAEWNVEGQIFQHIDTRTFTPTENQS